MAKTNGPFPIQPCVNGLWSTETMTAITKEPVLAVCLGCYLADIGVPSLVIATYLRLLGLYVWSCLTCI